MQIVQNEKGSLESSATKNTLFPFYLRFIYY